MILFGPHTVTAQPALKVRNNVGGWDVTYAETHTVTGCTVQFANPDETDTTSHLAGVIRCRGPWPWGTKTRITFDGREFDQDGEPKNHGIGVMTRHVEVRIVARSGVT